MHEEIPFQCVAVTLKGPINASVLPELAHWSVHSLR
jgi:hypothetical protein